MSLLETHSRNKDNSSEMPNALHSNNIKQRTISSQSQKLKLFHSLSISTLVARIPFISMKDKNNILDPAHLYKKTNISMRCCNRKIGKQKNIQHLPTFVLANCASRVSDSMPEPKQICIWRCLCFIFFSHLSERFSNINQRSNKAMGDGTGALCVRE